MTDVLKLELNDDGLVSLTSIYDLKKRFGLNPKELHKLDARYLKIVGNWFRERIAEYIRAAA